MRDGEDERAGRGRGIDLRALTGEHPQTHAATRRVQRGVDQVSQVAARRGRAFRTRALRPGAMAPAQQSHGGLSRMSPKSASGTRPRVGAWVCTSLVIIAPALLPGSTPMLLYCQSARSIESSARLATRRERLISVATVPGHRIRNTSMTRRSVLTSEWTRHAKTIRFSRSRFQPAALVDSSPGRRSPDPNVRQAHRPRTRLGRRSCPAAATSSASSSPSASSISSRSTRGTMNSNVIAAPSGSASR